MTPPELDEAPGREYRLEQSTRPDHPDPGWEPVLVDGTPEALQGGWGPLAAALAAARGLPHTEGGLRVTSRPRTPVAVEAQW